MAYDIRTRLSGATYFVEWRTDVLDPWTVGAFFDKQSAADEAALYFVPPGQAVTNPPPIRYEDRIFLTAANLGMEPIRSGTVNFSNQNGFTFGFDTNSVMTASFGGAVTAPFAYQLGGNTAGNSSGTVNTVFLAGGSNITLSATNGSITINGLTQSQQTNNIIRGIADSAGTQTSGTVNFANDNGITFGLNAGTLTASHNGLTSQSNQAFSAQGGSSTFQTLSFVNGNGATFTNNAGAVGISYTVPTVTNSSLTVSDAATSGSLARLAFTNLNGITLSLSTGAGGSHTIVGSHNALTSQSNQAVSAGNGSLTFQTLSLADSNGISFSTGTQGVFGTVRTNWASSDHSHGNPTLALTNISGTTNSNSNGLTISLSANPAGGADGVNILAAGSQTANTTGTVLFNNANGISFGMNNSSVITASHNGITQQSTQPSIQTIAFGNTTFTTGAVSFNNANGISFGSSVGGAVTASYTVPTVTNSSWTVSDNASSATVGRLAFTNLNGITLSLSTGAAGSHTIVGSHNALTSQSNQQITAGNGGFTFQTLSFSNVNGMSFGTSAGSAITASYTVPTQSVAPQSITLGGNTAGQSTLTGSQITIAGGNNITISGAAGAYTISGANQTNQQITAFAVSNTTQSSSGTYNASSIQFAGAGNVSVGISNGSVVISGGGAAAGVAGFAAGSQTGTSGTIRLVNGNGFTFGMSDSSNITASYLTFGQGFALGNTFLTSSSALDTRSISISAAGNLSVGMSVGAFVLSVAPQTVQTIGMFAGGNTTGQSSSSTYDARSLNFIGAGAASLGNSGGSIVISAATQTVQPGIQTVQFGNTTFTTGAISFSNTNGFSFGSTVGGQVTASYTVPTVTNSSMTISDAATSGSLARLAFTNLNGVTLSLSTGAGGSHTIVGSHNGLTSQSNQQITAANGGFAFQTLSFSNLNGISFGTSAGSAITASHNGITSQSVQTQGIQQIHAGTADHSSGTVIFADQNGITFGMNTGANAGQITASHNGLTSQSNQQITAANGGFTFQTLSFSNLNGMSFGTSAGSAITGSYTVPNTVGLLSSIVVNIFTGGNVITGGAGSITSASVGSSGFSVWAAGNLSAVMITGANSSYLALEGQGLSIRGNVSGGGGLSSMSSHMIDLQTGSAANKKVALYLSNGTMYGDYTTIAESKSFFIGGNTLGTSSGVSDVIQVAGGANITLSGNSNGAYTIIGPSPSAGGGPSIAGPGSTATDGTVTFSQGNGITFGLNANIMTASHNGLTGFTASAGTLTSNVNGLFFSDSNGIVFGLNGQTVTASISPIFDSHFARPLPFMVSTAATAPRQSTSAVFPINIEGTVSFGKVLMPISVSMGSTSFATTINTTFSMGLSETNRYVLYSRMTGASSQSLNSISSFSDTNAMTINLAANSTGSQYTITHGATYYDSRGSSSTWSTTAAISNASFQISTTHLTAFTGLKIRAFSLSGSLTYGDYWMVMGVSSTTATQGTAVLSGGRSLMSHIGLPNINAAIGFEGQSNNASIAIRSGIGSFTTAGGGTVSRFAFSNVSSQASHLVPYMTFVTVP